MIMSNSMLGMNRLQIELDRLYGRHPNANAADRIAAGVGHADGQRGIRALVLELAVPAGWAQLSAVWRGVQSDLDLPAPAIAVSGADGLQLWFSLASPISASVGALFLQGLRAQYLSDVGSTHVRLLTGTAELPAAPPVEVSPDRWSAFVTPDLASVFADTPWLDIHPADDGQATLLRTLEPTSQAAFEAALNQLGAIQGDEPPEPAGSKQPGLASVGTGQGNADAARFLAGVMNDPTAPLASRIEAAKALLPYAKRS
jgi:hypothetical protein